MEVQWNAKREQSLWGRLGKMLCMEGVETEAVVMSYRAVVQAVILFISEFWVLLL